MTSLMQSHVPSLSALVSDCPYFTLLLLAVGSVSFAKFAYRLVGVLLQTFILPGINLKKYGAGKGAWAVVTGASDGIGREFALQLANKGFNILLVSRNGMALSSLATEIETHPRSDKRMKTKVLSMDLGKSAEDSWHKFQAEVDALDVGILVHSAGVSHEMPVDFVDTTEEEMNHIVSLNVNGTVKVIKAILPGMVQRKRGLIVTVGSFSGGTIASPMLATYSGSKAFLASFITAIAEEVKGKGVDVECLNTYFVVSKISKIRYASAMVPSPKDFVRAAIGKVGLACGSFCTGRPHLSSPYWSHALLDWAIHFLGSMTTIIHYTHNLHISIRKRALKKKAAQKKQ